MNSTSSPRVGFIGLGSQGGPMARRIIEAGYPVTLWARRPATLEPFAATNAKTAGSPAELAACVSSLTFSSRQPELHGAERARLRLDVVRGERLPERGDHG